MIHLQPRVDERLYVAVAHAKGTKHQYYEDSFGMLTRDIPLVRQQQRGEVFSVFDGIGSAPEGRHAAQHMAEALLRFYREPETVAATADALHDLLQTANQEICDWGVMPGTDRPKGGCVGSVVWVLEDRLYLFHAGDTCGVHVRGGKAREFTHCHQTEDGAIFRYFGFGRMLKLQTDSLALEEGDRILLMSDGVTKHLHPTEAVNLCAGYPDPPQAAVELVRVCQGAGVSDDITAMVIDIEEIWE